MNLFSFLQNLVTFSPGIRDQMTAALDLIKCCETYFSSVISISVYFSQNTLHFIAWSSAGLLIFLPLALSSCWISRATFVRHLVATLLTAATVSVNGIKAELWFDCHILALKIICPSTCFNSHLGTVQPFAWSSGSYRAVTYLRGLGEMTVKTLHRECLFWTYFLPSYQKWSNELLKIPPELQMKIWVLSVQQGLVLSDGMWSHRGF